MTRIKVLDSTAAVDPADARAAGYSAILRYLAGGSPLTPAELATYTAASFGVGSLWELSPTAVADGENQGASDAAAAVKLARALGQPKGSAIYFACDTDPAGLPGGPSGGVPYYRGSALVRSAGYLNGCYGGAALVNACIGAGVIDRAMIPNAPAWADGQTPKREDVTQGYPYVLIAGAEYDPDLANPATAGLWNGHGLWPVAPPAPLPTSEEDIVKLVYAQGPAVAATATAPAVPENSWWRVGWDRTGRWAQICPTPQSAGTDLQILGSHETVTTAEMAVIAAGD